MSTKIGRNDPCWCGSGKKYKKCHEAFDAKVEMLRQKGYPVLDHKLIKTPEQIEKCWMWRLDSSDYECGRQLWERSARVTVHFVHSNTLRDAQKSCFA